MPLFHRDLGMHFLVWMVTPARFENAGNCNLSSAYFNALVMLLLVFYVCWGFQARNLGFLPATSSSFLNWWRRADFPIDFLREVLNKQSRSSRRTNYLCYNCIAFLSLSYVFLIHKEATCLFVNVIDYFKAAT